MTAKYDKELAEKMSAERAAARSGLPVYKEYPEGYRWIELNKPGSFSAESEAMGHSARGYEPTQGHPDWIEASGEAGRADYGLGGWEAIKSGKAKVYSLVDSKGAPHATIEVGQSKTLTPEKREKQMGFLVQRLLGEGMSEEKAIEQASKLYPESETMPHINQIKGKGNDALAEDYRKYGQDFVKSGKWSDVRDLENVGMYYVKKPEVVQKYGSPYLTQEEFDEATPLIYQTPDMKEGGSVDLAESDKRLKALIDAHINGMANGGLPEKIGMESHNPYDNPLPLNNPTPKTESSAVREMADFAKLMADNSLSREQKKGLMSSFMVQFNSQANMGDKAKDASLMAGVRIPIYSGNMGNVSVTPSISGSVYQMDKQRPQGQMGKPMVNVNWNKSFSDGGSAVFKNPILSRQAKPESDKSYNARKEISPVLQQKLREQIEDEYRALTSKSYQPEKGVYRQGTNVGGVNLNAAKDLGMQTATTILGAPSDFARLGAMGLDEAQSRIRALSKPESVMSSQTSPRLEDQSPRVPKFSVEEMLPKFGSSEMNDVLKRYGVMGEQDYPAATFVSAPLSGLGLGALSRGARRGMGKLSDRYNGIVEGSSRRVDEPLLSDEMRRILNNEKPPVGALPQLEAR